MSTEVQNRGISGPTKRSDVLQKHFLIASECEMSSEDEGIQFALWLPPTEKYQKHTNYSAATVTPSRTRTNEQ